MERKNRKDFNIAFDFDGTLLTEKWPDVGEPMHDMIDALKFLYRFGFGITIWTLRDHADKDSLSNCLDFIFEHDIPYDEFNQNYKYLIKHFGSDPRKISTDMYVDDRNAGGLLSPKDIVQEVIVKFGKKVKEGKCILPNQEIDGEFIDAYVGKYLTGTNLRRKQRYE